MPSLRACSFPVTISSATSSRECFPFGNSAIDSPCDRITNRSAIGYTWYTLCVMKMIEMPLLRASSTDFSTRSV